MECREVQRDRWRVQSGVDPGPDLGAGGSEDPIAGLADEASLFHRRDETFRQQQAPLFVNTAQQGLGTAQASAAHVGLGLEAQAQPAGLDDGAQALLCVQAQAGKQGPLCLVEGEAGLGPGLLGLIHGRVGILYEGFGVLAVLGAERDADAGFGVEEVPSGGQRRAEGGGDVLGDLLRVPWARLTGRPARRELVSLPAAPTRSELRRAWPRRWPTALSRSSPTRWPRVSLTALKRSRSRKAPARGLPSRRACCQGLVQAVEEIDPVGQARECIVEGLVADLLLGLFTVGDVVEHHEVGGFVIPNGLGGGHLRHTETPVRTQDVEFGMGPGAGVTEGESFEVRCRVPQGLLGRQGC